MIATLTEAIAGTALTLGKGDIIGDVYATPDEFAWLDIGYTTLKMIAFLLASWIATTVNLRIIVVAATVMITLVSAATALTTRLDLLIVLRAFQGFSGGLLLVIGQIVIFRDFSPSRQPVLQALFATGAVVAPATIVPALQGWLLDGYSWTWIFLSVVPIGLLAAGLVLLSEETSDNHISYRRFDWSGLLLASITLFCLVYVLSQGDRWNWFDERRVQWLTGIGVVTLCLFVGQQASRPEDERLLELCVFRSVDFTFAFIVSFVAGAALFGSTYLIRVLQSRSWLSRQRIPVCFCSPVAFFCIFAFLVCLRISGPGRLSNCHRTLRDRDDHDRYVATVRLRWRQRNGRHDERRSPAGIEPWLSISVYYLDRIR
ncbi:MFS transporter [Ochrobactrum intermedium]|nr:MFS transporter [Brucella intermedia]